MEEEDYYKILGIDRKASKDDIKKAYKELARKHHPDKGGDPDRFKKIAGAYSVLEDDQRRSMYDQFGKDGGEAGGGMPDIFNMFGGRFPGFGFPEKMRRKCTRDRLLDLDVTMEEAYHGVTVKFRFKRKVFMEGEKPRTCGMCHGKGRMMERMTSAIGIIQNIRLCTACAGMGSIMDEKQFKITAEIIDIVVPPHCHEGFQKIIPEKADEIPDHETGNLVIQIKIKKHPIFELVDGNDLLWKVKVHPLEALTSFQRTVRLPSGEDIVIEHSAGMPFFSMLTTDRMIERKGMFDPTHNRGRLMVRFIMEDFSFQEIQKPDLYRMAGLPLPPSLSIPSCAISIDSLPQHSSLEEFHTTIPSHSVQECTPS